MRPPKSEARRKLSPDELVSFVPMNDLGEGTKLFETREQKPLSAVEGSYTYFADGDVLLAKITPCFENGKLGIARNLKNGIGFGSSEYFVLRPTVQLEAEFLYYFLAQDSFRDAGQRLMTGAVGHKRVPKEYIEDCPIPLPPLDEQRRIVAVLDEAFAGLATMRANAEANLKNARALFDSHLNAIFSQKGEGWVETTLGDVCTTQYGISGSMNTDGKGYKIFRMGEVQRGRLIDTGTMKRIDLPKGEFEPYRLQKGDVLFNRTNSIDLVGKTGIFDNEGDYCFASYLIRVNFDLARIDTRFACHIMNSTAFLHRIRQKAAKSVNQANINATILRNEPIPLHVDVKMQSKIADQLDDLVTETDRLESLYRQKLAAIDGLKQSILQKAFAGELTSAEIAA